ncbi:1,2-phenylacetyl-CoA epoxidase subunit PaaE [Faecalibacter sp. LW9]|uniref:1,2-phenylacetyl-CoA epoxidase subunit PaaE n=1 Tax=Faecalibacter sp. LW9 TaxID=3103144 RepID=UPI002AFF491D|nr:1,2-phenylacetyl-CoA epoxidase subunit PaaE [Faecalibacter sp. LW9]
MAINFHKLTVKQIKRETPECVSVVLDVPAELQNDFNFKQGQYLTFKDIKNDEEIRRSYSICSSPLDGELRVAVKKIANGIFSTYVNENLQVGDALDVMTPQGNFFTEVDAANNKLYVGIVAGSGITPVLSIIKTVLQTEPNSKFILIYGNRNKGTIIFKEEIEALKNKYMERLSVYNILSRETADAEILSGRITKEKIEYFLQHVIDPKEIGEVFLCEPEDMILGGRDALVAAGVDAKNVHFELFYSASAEAKKAERQQAVEVSDDTMSKVTVKLDATSLQMDLGYNGVTILDAALQNGADLPYACKGGVCATCKCKVLEGEVEMDINYSLEPDEIAAGFVLSCQAHPRSANVVVDFDAK